MRHSERNKCTRLIITMRFHDTPRQLRDLRITIVRFLSGQEYVQRCKREIPKATGGVHIPITYIYTISRWNRTTAHRPPAVSGGRCAVVQFSQQTMVENPFLHIKFVLSRECEREKNGGTLGERAREKLARDDFPAVEARFKYFY